MELHDQQDTTIGMDLVMEVLDYKLVWENLVLLRY